MRLFWKLFLLQVLAVAAVLAGVLLVARAYSVRGFAEYIESRERERVEQLAGQLEELVAGGADLAEAWDAVPALRNREERMERRLRMDPPPDGGPPRERRVLVRRHMDGPPLQLQDADEEPVRGEPHLPPPHLVLREPIEVDGRVVGYLAWPRAPRNPAQIEFAHKQLMHMTRVAPIALLVAVVFAALITAIIVRPIRQLSRGTAALARREFGTRLPADRGDELGALARDFNRLAIALEGYDTRQRQWVADISHELRTPVAVLRGELEALLDGLRTADAAAMRSLREEVTRLEALIQDLHLVSIAESGGLRLHLAESDLGALARQAAERFRERLRVKGFSLDVTAPTGLTANVDAPRMEQVLANLLENALRHASPPGPIKVSARAEGGSIVLSVADAGPGVPPDTLPRLFDRLYRVETSRTRGNGGAGLGLAICKSIVEAHGGTIVARPSAAGGLEIALTLPCRSGS